MHQISSGNINTTSAPARSAAADLALLSCVLIVAILSFAKNLSKELNPWGEPYFFLSYADGFIKRGLVGHIFHTIYSGASAEAVRASALWSFIIASLLIIALLTFWFWQVAREWIALFALFAASQFLPTLASDTGYLDPYVYVFAIVASMALASDRFIIFAVIGFVGPLVHESFVFLWLPLIILAFWRGALRPIHTIMLGVPILSTLIVYFGHSQAAAIAQINAAPLSDWIKKSFIEQQFGFTLTTLLPITWHTKIYPNFINFIVALVFYTLPAALIALCYGSDRKDRTVLLLASYAPALDSLIAWDLSRFLVVTTLSAVIGLLFMQSTRRAVAKRSLVWCWPIAAILFALPPIYAFYDHAYIFTGGPLGFNTTPWANIIRSDVIPWYNRDYVP